MKMQLSPAGLHRILFLIVASILFFLPYSALALGAFEHSFSALGHPLPSLFAHIAHAWKEILLAAGLLVAGLKALSERRLPFPLTRLDYLLIGFIAVATLVGGLRAPDAHSYWVGFRHDLSPFLYYFLARCLVLDRMQIMRLIRNLTIFVLPLLVFACLQALALSGNVLSGIGGPAAEPVAGLHRAIGGFSSSSELGFYAAQLALLVWFCCRQQFSLWIGRAIAGLAVLVLALSFSPGPIVGLVAGCSLVGTMQLLHRYRPDNAKRYGSLILAGIAILGLIGLSFAAIRTELPSSPDSHPNLVQRFLQRDIPDGEVPTRQEVLSSIGDNPLGQGLGTTAQASPSSWYLQLGQELGLVGIMLAILMIVGVCMALWRLSETLHDKEDRRVLGYVSTGFLSLVFAFALVSGWLNAGTLTWWIVLGLFLADYFASLPGESTFFPIQKRADNGNTAAAL